MSDEANAQQAARNKAALDEAVGHLVKMVAEFGEARIKAEEHQRDQDNFVHAKHHRKVAVDARIALDRAVERYVAFRRGPQPDPNTT